MSTRKSVGIELEYWGIAVQSSAEARDFSLFQIVHTGSGAHPSYYSVDNRIPPPPGIKRSGREYEYSPPSVSAANFSRFFVVWCLINPLTPKDTYSGRTAPLTSKRCILYIYSSNTCTEYFKHGIYCPFSSLQNAVCFIILTYFVSVLFTFYIQSVLKFKKIIPTPKG